MSKQSVKQKEIVLRGAIVYSHSGSVSNCHGASPHVCSPMMNNVQDIHILRNKM